MKTEQSTRAIERSSEISELFANASTKTLKEYRGNKVLTKEELDGFRLKRQRNGVKAFKRHVLGLCGAKREVTVDELAAALYKTKVVPTIEKGRELIPSLDGVGLRYGFFGRHIRFLRESDDKYLVIRYYDDMCH